MPPSKRQIEQDAVRACDACRARKIRCDKGSPCSNCKSSGALCRTTTAQHGEPRSRVMISKEYEKKLDVMSDRLASIERLLRTQQGASSEERYDGTNNAALTPKSIAAASTPGTTLASIPAPAFVRTDVTLGAQSTEASVVVEQAIGESPIAHSDVELAAALRSLGKMVSKIGEPPDKTDAPAPADDLQDFILSEVDQIVEMSDGSFALAWSPGLTVMTLQDKCRSVFQGGGQATANRRVYVYGVLSKLCSEYAGSASDSVFAERCKTLSRNFADQVESAVADLKLITPASPEAIAALTTAALLIEERGKPHLALTLSATAASMVVSLGYHRLSTMQSDPDTERQTKILLFWMAYWNDCSFAIRLGRAPVIRHHDITVPRLEYGSMIPNSFVDAFNYCIRICALQCQAVEKLYSPLSLQQTAGKRAQQAAELVEQAHEAWKSREKASPNVADDMIHAGLYLLMKDSGAVLHYSTIALIEHATIANPYSESPALGAARRALAINVEIWRTYQPMNLPDTIWAGHCHWALLKMPITPFVVLFCHIIRHPSMSDADLQLLAQFVATLQNLGRFSIGIVRLHRLCGIFEKVASLYVRAKAKDSFDLVVHHDAHEPESNSMDIQHHGHSFGGSAETQHSSSLLGQPIVEDIDGYLSSIGFGPAHSDDFDSMLASHDAFDPAFLSDWYTGSSALTGLLDQEMLFPT